MNSPDLTVQKLKKLDHVHATIGEFLRRRTWSIATGAMLISGVLPAAQATKIPDEGSQLLDPALPASLHQLGSARSVMEEWAESHEDDEGSRSDVPAEKTPIAFICWCAEAYRGALSPPELLHYFLGLAGFHESAPAPHDIVERLLELEQHATVERGRPSSSANSEMAAEVAHHPSRKHFAVRMDALMLKGRVTLSIAMRIADALDQIYPSDGYQPLLVWRHLLDMAQSGKYGELKSAGPRAILIPAGKGGTKTCTYRTVSQFLTRRKNDLLGTLIA